MDVLSSRILLHPTDLALTRRFYSETLGLAIYREFGDPANPAMVFFVGGGFLELSAGGPDSGPSRPDSLTLWMQVRDVSAEYARLVAAGVAITRGPQLEPWGLWEMWFADPDGVRIVLVEIPAEHPLRTDARHIAVNIERGE